MGQTCPICGSRLNLTRIEDITVAEYKAYCSSCGLKNSLRQLRCGGCHERRLFRWIDENWRCVHCGHIRCNSSPPRTW